MSAGWNWILARLNRIERRQTRMAPVVVVAGPQAWPRALEPGLIDTSEAERLGPGERTLKRLREAGL